MSSAKVWLKECNIEPNFNALNKSHYVIFEKKKIIKLS